MLAPLLALGLLAASCGGGSEAAAVRAALTSSTIRVEPAEVVSGPVLLKLENMSMSPHSVVVLRTDTPYDKIAMDPTDPDDLLRKGMVARVEVPGQQTAELKMILPRGRYVVLCGHVEHYEWGMRAPLVVR